MDGGMSEIKYYNKKEISYYSKRYNKWKTVPEDYPSDGATFAVDIYSDAWWVHDILKDHGTWNHDVPCSNIEASYVLYDILISEGRWYRARRWFVATLVFGEIKRYFSGVKRFFRGLK